MTETPRTRLARAILETLNSGHRIVHIYLNPETFAPGITQMAGIPASYGTSPDAFWELQLAAGFTLAEIDPKEATP